MTQQVILITGASSGIGEATAKALAAQGYRVFGTSRKPHEGMDNVTMLELDVREDTSVETCVQDDLLHAGRLDVLINNAGYGLYGAVEELSLEEVRAQFETNFFGAVRVTKAVLPLMRAQGSGKIINVSSLAGVIGLPYHSYYAATKFALEGWSESLRLELLPFGLYVSLVQLSFTRTNFAGGTVTPQAPLAVYDLPRERTIRYLRGNITRGAPPEVFTHTVKGILEARIPKLRYRVDAKTSAAASFKRLLPFPLFTWTMNLYSRMLKSPRA